MNITNLPILLEIAKKDRVACQLLCQASKAFRDQVYREDGSGYYNILFPIHGFYNWNHHCQRGNLRAIKWIHYNIKIGCYVDVMDVAAEYGHLEIVKWLHYNRNEGCTARAMDMAARNGYLTVVQWLHHNRSEGCTNGAMIGAAWNGRIEIVQWLYHNRTENCVELAMDSAFKNGKLEIVEWLRGRQKYSKKG